MIWSQLLFVSTVFAVVKSNSMICLLLDRLCHGHRVQTVRGFLSLSNVCLQSSRQTLIVLYLSFIVQNDFTCGGSTKIQWKIIIDHVQKIIAMQRVLDVRSSLQFLLKFKQKYLKFVFFIHVMYLLQKNIHVCTFTESRRNRKKVRK